MSMVIAMPYFRQQTDYTCGPACLRMLFALHKLRLTEQVIVDAVGTSPARGTRRDALVKAVKKQGFRPNVSSKGTWKDVLSFLKAGTPVMVEYREPGEDMSHYAVIIGQGEGSVVFHDPDNGKNFSIPLKNFRARWLGHRTRDPKWGWMMTVELRPQKH